MQSPHDVIITHKKWEVPAKETLKVDSRLAVFSYDEIAIEGTLQIEKPGIQVILAAPTITITGSIKEATQSSAKRTATPKVFDVIAGCAMSFKTGDGIYIPSGDDLAIAALSDKSCSISSTATISGVKGLFGTLRPVGLRNGQDGGSIYVGTTNAISIIEHILAGTFKYRAHVYEPKEWIFSGGDVQAGSGGTGASTTGTTNPVRYFAPGNGGKGGSLEIAVGDIKVIAPAQPLLSAGIGGLGGSAGPNAALGTTLDGTASHPDGYDAVIAQSGGGDGGNVSVKTKGALPKSVHLNAGDGGDPGLLADGPTYGAFLSGGNGYNDASPAANGNGGSLTITLGHIGVAGTGDHNPLSPAENGVYPPLSITGSAGGSAPAYSAATPGGNGGNLTINGSTDGKPLPATYKITIDGFGPGGLGQSPCGAAGAAGGNAGNLTLGATVPFAQMSLTGVAFEGGAGGFGTPPGAGGAAGTLTNTGATIGTAGAAGYKC